MFADNRLPHNRCIDCSLDFDTPHQLQNHKRRFCLNSGYDNLEGLAKMEWQGVSPPHKPSFSHKNHLQQYGSHSLTNVSDYRHLTQDNLDKDMRNINKFKRQLEGSRKYKHGQPTESQATSIKSKLNQSKLTQNSYSQSRLDEELKRYEKPVKEEAISPPTFIDQLNMKNHTVLDKSNSSLGRMAPKDKIEYAKVKRDQLAEIKQLYIQNGGNRPEFKANVDKMINFYENFLKQQQVLDKKEQNGSLNSSQQFVESRCSTPILKLRNFQEENKQSQASSVTNKRARTSKANEDNRKREPQSVIYPGMVQQNGVNGLNYGCPAPVIMVPYPQPPSNSTDSLKVLQKMIQLKSEQNKKLLEIMLEDRKRSNNITQNYPPHTYSNNVGPGSSLAAEGGTSATAAKKPKKGMIDVEDDYQFKKSMIDDLISQQKVLLALQQQQLDELKLLSQLPKDLQQIKLQSVMKASETRFQVEKELLKQKMQRLAYQEENQTFEEERKIHNDRWAGEERKKLLEDQMGRYLDNFQSQLLSE